MKLIYILSIAALVHSTTSYVHGLNNLNGKQDNIQVVLVPEIRNLLIPAIKLATKTCQEMFQWSSWNCQEADFATKLFSKGLDRETVYVRVLGQTAFIYEITKACSYDAIPGCEFGADTPANELKFAFQILDVLFNESLPLNNEIGSTVRKHNMDVLKRLLIFNVRTFCKCKKIGSDCKSLVCAYKLKPFPDIIRDIADLFESATFSDTLLMTKMLVTKPSPNTLVYVEKSRDYCAPDAATEWIGVKGRECPLKDGKQNWERCQRLCKSCGFKLMQKKVIKAKECNCNFTSCCGMQCRTCPISEKVLTCG